MTLEEQMLIADETIAFLNIHGLKAKHIANKICVKEYILSRFVNHKLVLTEKQLTRLKNYMSDYTVRMA